MGWIQPFANEAAMLMKILLFLCLGISFDFLIRLTAQNRVIEKSAAEIYKKTRMLSEERQDKEKQLLKEEGNQEKVEFLYHLDMMMEQSNLKKWLPFLNTEFYILGAIIAGAGAVLLTESLTGMWICGILTMLGIMVAAYLLIYILAGINYRRVEKNIITFCNLLENYSKSNDDIVSIFRYTVPYLEEPLKAYVMDFTSEAYNTGDIGTAFKNLTSKVEHEKFRDIIRNIDICSRHEANYEAIIADNRTMLKEYLKGKEERKSIINNGRLEIGILLLSCGLIIWMFRGFVDGMGGLLLGTFIGNMILLYCGIVLLLCAWVMISFDKG